MEIKLPTSWMKAVDFYPSGHPCRSGQWNQRIKKHMEKQLKIKTKDGHIVYGTLTAAKRKSAALVIFVHGLAGNRNEHIFFNGAKYFSQQGYNVFRFDLYSEERLGRTLSNTNLADHVSDLEAVYAYLRKTYKKVFIVGHDLGSLIALTAELPKVNGLALWEPVYRKHLEELTDRIRFEARLNGYVLSQGVEYVMGKEMYEEIKNVPAPKDLMLPLAKTPVKIIAAAKGNLVKAAKEYFKFAKRPKAFALIKNATHCFDEEGAEELLFKETYKFIKKYR
jgi:dienelactone hydrolase